MRRSLPTAVARILPALALAGCHASRSGSAVPGQVPASGTISHPTVVTVPVPSSPGTTSSPKPLGASPSTLVEVPGGGSYVLSLARQTGQGPCPSSGLGGSSYAFSVTVTNRTSVAEPLARLGLSISNPSATRARPVVAISYQGVCLDFTERGGTVAPGQSVTYQGTASGASSSSVVTARVISTPDNYTLGSLSLSLAG